MAKVAFMFLSSLVLVMSIRMVTSADAPTGGSGWSALADKVGGVFNSNDVDDNGSPAVAADQIGQAAAPASASMRGASQAFSNQASQAMEDAKQETVTWGDWLKHKLG